jgi:hypothetical protein
MKKLIKIVFIAIAGFFGLLLVAGTVVQLTMTPEQRAAQAKQRAEQAAHEAAARAEREAAAEKHQAEEKAAWAAAEAKKGKVELVSSKYHKGGLDTIMLATLAVRNTTRHDVKDIAIDCDEYAASGTKIDHNKRIIYEIVKAGQTRTFTDFNMGFVHPQTNTVGCSVANYGEVR